MLSLGGLNSGSLKDLQLVISFSTGFAIHTKVRGRAWSHCLGNIAKIKLPMKVTIQFRLPLAPGGEEQGCHHLFFWVSLLPAPTLSAASAEASGMLSQRSTSSRSFVSASAAPFARGAHSLPCTGARRRCAAEPVENDWVASLLNIIVRMW